MKKLSIIIPFKQYKDYLNEALKSLVDSTFKDFEVILVMDNDHDDISDLLLKYEKQLDLKKYELTEGHQGVGAARNLGITKANGEYLYFLDSDDYLLDDTLMLLSKHLDGKNQLVYGKIRNTWNNKANFLEKIKEEETIDEDDLEEIRKERNNAVLDNIDNDTNPAQALAINYVMYGRKGFRNYTVLGMAYLRSFIIDNHISFNESLIYYSDMSFISEALDKLDKGCEQFDSIYVKRKHNDKINMPALSQINDENRFEQRLKAVEYTRTRIKETGKVRYYLDYKLVMYMAYNFGRNLRRSSNEAWRNEYFESLRTALKPCNKEMIGNLKRWQKRMYNKMVDNNLKGVLKIVRNRLMIKKLKKAIHNKNVLYKTFYYHVAMKKPIKNNVIMFESFRGQSYSDSPKYLFEYLNEHYADDYKFVWVLNKKEKIKNSKVVRRFSFKYVYYLAVSKYLVFNVRQPLFYRKREGQIFLETWHGTPLKRLVFDQKEVMSASPKYKEQFFKQRKDWDYLISDNPFSTKTFRRCFMYENKMLEYGYPRNDILYSPNKEELSKKIKEKLNLPLNKKVILYAPTWRDDEYYGSGQYKFSLFLDLKEMQKRFSDEYIILLRMHYYISDNLDISEYCDFAYDVSKYDDISELYLISDMCITDYSSVFFDYANLKRPLLFFTYDLNKYQDQLRGFYIDMHKDLPGPLLKTNAELFDAIDHIDQIQKQYADKYAQFYDEYCCYDDGHASEKIVKEVFRNDEK